MLVTLTPPECRVAAQAGLERRLGHLAARTAAVYGEPASDVLWDIDLEAAGAELAVAKALGRYWAPAVNAATDRVEGDVGAGVQVRWTRRDDGRLIVHERDADDHTFVLVVGAMPTFRIAGYIRGADAKHPDHWWARAPRPAYFVTQSALAPVVVP